MNAVKYLEKLQRMCGYYASGKGCAECPLSQLENYCSPSSNMTAEERELSVQIVSEWSKKHKKTVILEE